MGQINAQKVLYLGTFRFLIFRLGKQPGISSPFLQIRASKNLGVYFQVQILVWGSQIIDTEGLDDTMISFGFRETKHTVESY